MRYSNNNSNRSLKNIIDEINNTLIKVNNTTIAAGNSIEKYNELMDVINHLAKDHDIIIDINDYKTWTKYIPYKDVIPGKIIKNSGVIVNPEMGKAWKGYNISAELIADEMKMSYDAKFALLMLRSHCEITPQRNVITDVQRWFAIYTHGLRMITIPGKNCAGLALEGESAIACKMFADQPKFNRVIMTKLEGYGYLEINDDVDIYYKGNEIVINGIRIDLDVDVSELNSYERNYVLRNAYDEYANKLDKIADEDYDDEDDYDDDDESEIVKDLWYKYDLKKGDEKRYVMWDEDNEVWCVMDCSTTEYYDEDDYDNHLLDEYEELTDLVDDYVDHFGYTLE